MKLVARSLILAAGLVTTFSGVGTLHADEAMALAPKDGMRPGTPPPLAAAKRTLKIASALKQLGVVTPPSEPALEMHLTPMTPRLPNGAQIVRMGGGTFLGPSPNEPDGSFTLMRTAGSMLAMSSVEMRVPTEPGKYYLVDCRLKTPSPNGTQLAFSHNNKSTMISLDDGHLVTAFAATTAVTSIGVTAMAAQGNTSELLAHFYGCDVGKAS